MSGASVDTLDFMDLIAAAGTLAGEGRADEAASLYQAWIESRPDHPLLHAVLFNCGTIRHKLGQPDLAASCFRRAIELQPDFLPPYINLGNIFEQAGDRLSAVGIWKTAAGRLSSITRETIDHKLMALNQAARVLALVDLDQEAEQALAQSLTLDGDQDEITRHWINLRQRRLQWPMLASMPPERHRRILERIAPLTLASWSDDPLWQLGNAAAFTKALVGHPGTPLPDRDPAGESPSRRLRVGYLSADLWEHAVGFLTAEIFALHDRSKVEIFIYHAGETRTDGLQARIREGADHWRDIQALGDREAAGLIAADHIDILVDLSGHTKDARTAMLGLRPAPVIVNWLGYPGSMGSVFHHYIIADPFIIPPDSEIFYSERVRRLSCYQPTDRRRLVSDAPQRRADAGLPEEATVFCCFNEPRKITQSTWRRWSRILRAVPDSVLWLLVPAETTQDHLRALAERDGVAPTRLVFAPRQLNPDHLARYVLADLILDSFPYGSHTTASDALWMGVPVLTLTGRSFASRVCGSLLTAAGLPELICESEEDYVAKAIRLGTEPAERARLRRRLAESRDTCLLFDTPRLVAELDSLYRGMWEDFLQGRRPRPDLSNVEHYRDIGVELALDPGAPAAELAAYRQRLEERGAFSVVTPDSRLA